jgi:hypothetical protein
MRLICYPTLKNPPVLRPAPTKRDWMGQTPERFAYRCLPLVIANSHGWELLVDRPFAATWSGGASAEELRISFPDENRSLLPASHFGHGILTFQVGYLFETEESYNFWIMGPINLPKDGIGPLSGIIETDWIPYSFTMNWMFTRPGTVCFEKGEPFCHFLPIPRRLLSAFDPEIRDLEEVPDKARSYESWLEYKGQTKLPGEGWDKHYFKGQSPDGEVVAKDHETRLAVKSFTDRSSQQAARTQGSDSPRTDFLSAARGLARELFENRLCAKDGSVTWQRPNRSTVEGAPPLVPAGPHLYDGLPGIAVFFAALGRVELDREYQDFSLQIVAPLRLLLKRLVADPERARKMSLGVGGLVGLSSFVYSLVTLGRLLERPELLEEAHGVVGLITPEHIAADHSLDVVSGVPGAILALLMIDRYLSGPTQSGVTPLEVANACADHLLSQRVDRSDGTTVWTTDPRFPPLTGFAHGSTGISCALLKLHARTGRQALLDTALRAWAFERSTYSEEHQDWLDQTSPTPLFANQWCFGAPGIALARLATLDLHGDEVVRTEIRNGLKITSDLTLSKMDHICCGNMGRADILAYAFSKLGEPGFYDTACEIARGVLVKAEKTGRFQGLVRSDYRDPSFFSGEAGIGYTLLRLACPGELPCLLAVE